jgi:hypothetical protein
MDTVKDIARLVLFIAALALIARSGVLFGTIGYYL